MGESRPFLFLSLSGLELKYRACRDHRGRFASCGGGSVRSQDLAHIRTRTGQETRPGPHDREIQPVADRWEPAPADSFRKFEGYLEPDAWGRPAYDPWARGLSDEERAAVRGYTGIEYRPLNDSAQGKPFAEIPGRHLYRDEADLKARTDVVDRALRRGQAPEAITTYRGIEDIRALGVPDLDRVGRGDVLKESGFASTSLLGAKAGSYAAGGPAPATLEIRVPKGAPGAYVNAGGISEHPGEMEFALPRGARYRVVGRGDPLTATHGAKVPRLIVEYVP